MSSRSITFALALAALFAGSACFKSSTLQGSSESSSKSSRSSSASSASSSGSSSASSRESAFVQDLSDYTKTWVLSGGDVATFQRRVGAIAKDHGVTDWERDEDIYKAIGRGLKRAGIQGDRLTSVKRMLAGPDPKSAKWIQSGYDSEQVD